MRKIDPRGAEHDRELDRLARFLLVFGVLAGATYLVPSAQSVRPWLPAEPLPLARLVEAEREVQLDERGELVLVEAPPAPLVEVKPTLDRTLPLRPPAIPTEIEGVEVLESFFEALAFAETGEPGRVVRVLHWGDSTIAADGITGRVRQRLQARFGDGGPGFVPIHVDTRWQIRPGILRTQVGAWETLNVTFGGAPSPRYGLAGNVSTSAPERESRATLGGLKIQGKRQPIHRFDVHLQARPGGGRLSLGARGVAGRLVSTDAQRVRDLFVELRSTDGARGLSLKTRGDGPVTIYGVAMETDGPGLTWETFGVAGASIASINRHQGRSHLRRQVERRDPDLLVYLTGGNELSYPSLEKGEGELYEGTYLEALAKLRGGKPEAACLVISPLDQARRSRGKIVSKPNLDKMIGVQKRAAEAAGCAFWNARNVMGSEGGIARWIRHRPQLASTDLIHLTGQGLNLVGDSLADGLLAAYESWRWDNPDVGWRHEDVEDNASEPPAFQGAWEVWIPSADPGRPLVDPSGEAQGT